MRRKWEGIMQAVVGVSFGMGVVCLGIALVISELVAIRKAVPGKPRYSTRLGQKKA
jgi:hypothetical protein